MSKTFKIVLILLVVASIASAVLAVFAFMEKEKEYMKRLLVEDKLAATLKDKRRLEKEIDMNKKLKEEAELKVTEIEAKIKSISSQVEELKDRNKAATLELAAKKDKIVQLEEDLEKEMKEKLNISKKLEDLQFEYDKSKSEVAKLKNKNIELEQKISDLKEKSVDLDTIVVSPSTSSVWSTPVEPVRELLRGSVLVVNKDYSFVVTDLGKSDGVEKGMVVEIRDGIRSLGRAEIDKVYDTMSSASLLPGTDINNVKKGNIVIESR